MKASSQTWVKMSRTKIMKIKTITKEEEEISSGLTPSSFNSMIKSKNKNSIHELNWQALLQEQCIKLLKRNSVKLSYSCTENILNLMIQWRINNKINLLLYYYRRNESTVNDGWQFCLQSDRKSKSELNMTDDWKVHRPTKICSWIKLIRALTCPDMVSRKRKLIAVELF